ncbi:hypothetical protein QTJ16_000295 [Diplocarpon rosae]|uniref:Helicase C-terminal domain-containing protein n=1 Tax=Diplocarpon rosae TaxID=946125 RepID=A0AAD9WFI7_9HELO|nr:hypothetical protein QTJ16_000295 [Diplocarpon rosae]
MDSPPELPPPQVDQDVNQSPDVARTGEAGPAALDIASPNTSQPALRQLRPQSIGPSATAAFESWMITVNLRIDMKSSIADKPISKFEIRPSSLLNATFRDVPNGILRPNHLSYRKLKDFLKDEWKTDLDTRRNELGWVRQADETSEGTYYVITSELTFQSAVSCLWNDARTQPSVRAIHLHLWKGSPEVPVPGGAPRKKKPAPGPQGMPLPNPVPRPKPIPQPKPASLQGSASPSLPGPSSLPKRAPLPKPAPPPEPGKPSQGQRVDPSQRKNPPDGGDNNNKGRDNDIDLNDIIEEENIDPDLSEPDGKDFEGDPGGLADAWRDYQERKTNESLQEMLNPIDSEITTHLTPETWQKACSLFTHDAMRRDPGYIVKCLYGIGVSAWHCITYFPCSGNGSTKTTVAFIVHHVQNVYNILWDRINQNPNQHISKDADDMTGPCPSAQLVFEEYGFHCPCSSSSPGHFIKPRTGATLVLSPTGLLDTWTREFNACLDPGDSDAYQNRFGYSLARAHGGASPTADQWNLLQGKEEILPLTEDGEIVNGVPQMSWFSPLRKNGRVIILSTTDSVDSKFLSHQSNRKVHSWDVQEYNKAKAKDGGGEAQKEEPYSHHISCFSKVHCVQAVLRAQRSNGLRSEFEKTQYGNLGFIEVSLNWLSGTPLVSGPSDIAPLVELMVRDEWIQDPELKKWRRKELVRLGLQWAKNIKKGAVDEEVTQQVLRALPQLVEALFIRFTLKSVLLDRPVVIIPRNIFKLISATHPGEWQEKASQIALNDHQIYTNKNLKAKAKFLANKANRPQDWTDQKPANLYYRSRVVATFPFLATMINPRTNLPFRLTNNEFQELTTSSDDEPALFEPGIAGDPFFDNLKEICRSSGKLIAWKNELAQFQPPGFLDAEGRPSRHIVTTYFFVVAHIFKMWLLHIERYTPDDVLLVHSMMSPMERTATLDKFHLNVGSNIPLEDQRPARFLVATSSAIATGLTLAEAISVCFLEVDYYAHTMEQGFCRHCRQGNKNAVVYSWVIQNDENPTEERIFNVNALRSKIQQVQARKQSARVQGAIEID